MRSSVEWIFMMLEISIISFNFVCLFKVSFFFSYSFLSGVCTKDFLWMPRKILPLHKNSIRIQIENKWMKIGDNIYRCVFIGFYGLKSASRYSITWIIVHTVYPDCMHHTLQPIVVMVHYAANVLEAVF